MILTAQPEKEMQDSFRQFLENNSDKELANNANAFKELGSQF